MFSCAFAMEFLGGHPGERTATRRIRHLPKGLPPFNGKGRILMKRTPEHGRPWRKWLVAPALLLAVLAMSGCQTLSYYGQAIKGQYQIVAHEQKIKKLLADPQTPAPLKANLQLVQGLRAFAAKDLQLPVDGHYEKYADMHRPFVVWTVEAAPEFSLEPKTWWYPFTGSLRSEERRVGKECR